MNENGWGNDMQYQDGYHQQYDSQQYGNGNDQWYDSQQYGNGNDQRYDGQQYGNGNDQWYDGQQYNSGYQQQYGNGNQQQYESLQESLPEGVMERLPGWIRDKVEDAMAMADRESLNRERYGHVEPYSYYGRKFPLITGPAVVIGFGGAFFFIFIKHNYMVALICFGIMLIMYGIKYLTDKDYCFRKAPAYTMVPVLGVIFILVAAYHLFAKYFPALPQPKSRGIEVWACGLFSVIGAVLLVLDCIRFWLMKKVCTEPVSAVCVYVKKKVVRSKDSKTTKYSGVFEYQFRGNTYLAAEAYGNKGDSKVGSRYELCINPNEPTDFYRKSWKLLVSSLIGYLLFIVFPLILSSQF